MRRIRRALFVGRFEPYHLGHHWVVKRLAKRFDEVLLVIGTAKKTRTKRNPLTAWERERIIKRVWRADGVRNARLFVLIDRDNDKKWTRDLLTRIPAFTDLYSNHLLTRRLMRERGFRVHWTGRFKGIRATRVRDSIRRNGRVWRKLMHPEAVRELEERGLIRVIAKCAK